MITEAQAGQLEELYKTYVAQRTAASASAANAAAGLEAFDVNVAKSKFVLLWPSVKQGLHLLKQLSAPIPGAGAIIGVVIGMVITAGDALFKALEGQ